MCRLISGYTQIVYIANSLTPYKQTGIKCDVDEEVAMKVQELSANMPGVGVRVNSIREYPTGYDTSEVVGFLGPIPDLISTEMEERGFILDKDKYGYEEFESSLQEFTREKRKTGC